ncbi:unnamed protein product [Chironomus riparius]|uniref:Uncharacterized protein n=1 Tax=Chironomus riparius TaxID=315576 RepID=A0A9N9RSK2_9DIPT|nr:unnamed protein product [Chironomus riparius]
MKFIVTILFLASAVLAQFPTGLEISADFLQANTYYSLEAVKFVDKLAAVLDERVLPYIAAHEKLVKHFESIKEIPGVKLDANGEQIMDRLTTRITNMINNYPNVLDRNIFSREMQRHMDMLNSGYIKQAEGLITDLVSYVTKNPNVGKCWMENRDEIMKIVQNGFLAARDAGITTITNANATLNTNEILIEAMITSDTSFIEMCKSTGIEQVNGCIGIYLSVADLTVPASASMWEMTTNTTVTTNLQIAESLIQTAAQIAVIQITQIVGRIEACVVDVLRQTKS